MSCNRVCFDIETEPFSKDFQNAFGTGEKVKYAPLMRVACVYSEINRKYRFFTPDDAADLLEVLRSADEVISFNGKDFDMLVLRRHHGLKGKLPAKGNHIDIHRELTKRAGFLVSLDLASKINLGEGKHTHGRKMNDLDISALRGACQSDVRQTFRLWKLYDKGKLKAPRSRLSSLRQGLSRRTLLLTQRLRSSNSKSGDWQGGPGHWMPDTCPVCHDVGSLRFADWHNEDDLTEGQFAEYLAGTQGSAICETCNAIINWNV